MARLGIFCAECFILCHHRPDFGYNPIGGRQRTLHAHISKYNLYIRMHVVCTTMYEYYWITFHNCDNEKFSERRMAFEHNSMYYYYSITCVWSYGV